MLAIEHITARRFTAADVAIARFAICRGVRRTAYRRAYPTENDRQIEARVLAARWRRGSNAWRPESMRGLRDHREPFTPCPNCGADGSELRSNLGREFCRCCGEDFVVGDYDPLSLADSLALAADLATGDVEPTDRCRTCDRLIDPGLLRLLLSQVEPLCASVGCPLGGDLVLRVAGDEPAAVEPADAR